MTINKLTLISTINDLPLIDGLVILKELIITYKECEHFPSKPFAEVLFSHNIFVETLFKSPYENIVPFVRTDSFCNKELWCEMFSIKLIEALSKVLLLNDATSSSQEIEEVVLPYLAQIEEIASQAGTVYKIGGFEGIVFSVKLNHAKFEATQAFIRACIIGIMKKALEQIKNTG